MWDLLYQRYSNPMMLLDQMIQAGRLCEFIVGIIDIKNEETKSKAQWEFYLHKVFSDKSFADYLKETEPPAEPEFADRDVVETTVKNSMNILENFNME